MDVVYEVWELFGEGLVSLDDIIFKFEIVCCDVDVDIVIVIGMFDEIDVILLRVENAMGFIRFAREVVVYV